MTEVQLAHALRYLGREAEKRTEEALAPIGITPARYAILESIDTHMQDPGELHFGPVRIAQHTSTNRHTASSHVQALTDSGHIRLAPGGSRLLTAKGIELLTECRWRLVPVNQALRELLASEDMEAIAEAFNQQQERTD